MRPPPSMETGRPSGEGPDPRGEAGLNLAISRVLAGGLILAVLLLLAGVFLILAGRDAPLGGPASIGDMPRAIAALDPVGFFYLGLLVLLLTPVCRVMALAVAFARRRTWLFCSLSVFVLAVLGLSAYLGLRG
jgi:uncharacterized membrane protein